MVRSALFLYYPAADRLPQEFVKLSPLGRVRSARRDHSAVVNGAARRRIGRAKIGKFDIGGQHRNRTCDHHNVNVVLYR